MREMKDSGVQWIGSVSAKWKLLTIGSLFKLRNEKVNDTDYPPLSVSKGGIVPQMENVAKTDANDNRKMVLTNDFVINSRSDRKQSCGVSPLDGSVSLINTVLYPSKGAPIVPAYLNYLLKNYGFAEEFYRWGHGIVADLWTTHWQEMKSILLPIPSMEEQCKLCVEIKDRSDKVDVLLSNVQFQIEKLKAYKQSLITEVVTKGLDPTVPMKDSGVKLLNNIPQTWSLVCFKNVATVKTNLVDPGAYGDFLQVSPENIEKGSGKLLECRTVSEIGVISNNHLFHKGQLLYSKVRPKLNKVCIAPFDGLCSADMYPIETEFDISYLLYIMLSVVFLSQVSMITENRVKMPKINQMELGSLQIPFTYDIHEQEGIASYLDEKCAQIDRLIAIKQQKIDKLNRYKKSLIYEYVTGKKEVV